MASEDITCNQGDEGEPGLRDRNTILAYLEELEGLGAPVQLGPLGEDGAAVPARITRVDEEGITVAFPKAPPPQARAGQLQVLAFTMDGTRFVAPILSLAPPSGGHGRYSLPDVVNHAERRARMRARFGAREKATVTALEGLFDGTGVTGRLLDLSMAGLCMQVERAMSIELSRPLATGPGLFPSGTALPIVRIQQIASTPTLECSGRVAHLEDGPQGLTLGIRFEGLDPREVAALQQVMGRRLPTFSRAFPVRRRRNGLGAGPVSPPAGGAEVPARASEVPASDRSVHLARRNRRLLLILFDDLDRAILAGTLQVDGWRKVMEARNYVEALNHCRTQAPDLIVIDQMLGVHPAQEFLERLRKASEAARVPTVLLCERADVRTTLMAKAARIDRVVEKPVDFDGAFRQVLVDLLQAVPTR